MALTNEQISEYKKNGFLIVPGVFAADRMDRALQECDRITYGKPYAEWAQTATADTPAIADGMGAKGAGRTQFPTGVDVLDNLFADSDYLDAVEQLLESDEVNYCNAHLFVRAGPNDKRYWGLPWQGYHIDHDTCTFIPPMEPVGFSDYLNTSILLHDIKPTGAPITMIAGSHHDVARNFAKYFRAGWSNSRNRFEDIRKVPEFTADRFQPTVGTKGSVLFYSSYTVHAAVPFQDKTVQRALWGMSFSRRSIQPWTGYSLPFAYPDREHFHQFWEQTTPRARSLFGWPRPGHRCYTPQTLELLHGTFPKMDLAPYYNELPR